MGSFTDPRLIKRVFPHLVDGFWLQTSEVDGVYNCIAWAAQDKKNWWWPSGKKGDYWPPGVPLQETISAFILAYGTLGYTQCGMDISLEDGFEKVAIYAIWKGGRLVPTHAARQLESGCWTSKLGRRDDIEHMTIKCVTGAQGDNDYGQLACVLKRPR